MRVQTDYLTTIAIYPDYAFLLDYKERLSNDFLNKIFLNFYMEEAFPMMLISLERYKRELREGDFHSSYTVLQDLYRITEIKKEMISDFMYQRFRALGNNVWDTIGDRVRQQKKIGVDESLEKMITRFIHLCLKIIYGALS